MSKFTFKKHPRETGLSGVGYPYQSVYIKLAGKVIGTIYAPNWQTKDDKWGVSFRVKNSEPDPCEWKWVHLKARFDSEQDARNYLLNRCDEIQSEIDLVGLED